MVIAASYSRGRTQCWQQVLVDLQEAPSWRVGSRLEKVLAGLPRTVAAREQSPALALALTMGSASV